MKFSYALLFGAVLTQLPVRAIYAPLPEQDQGKDLMVTLRTGFTYDTNIFGAPAHTVGYAPDGTTHDIKPIASDVWEVAPRVTYYRSISDQTFFSLSYGLLLDEFENRPGQKLLPSHNVNVRLAHAFSQSSTIDFSDTLDIARNPQALLPLSNVPVNTDQSLTHNQLDGHYAGSLTPKIGIEVKARSAQFSFRNEVLKRMLDHIENLYGLAGNYAVLPEFKAVGEVRHQDVYYSKQGYEEKNKRSNYAMAGFDYALAKKFTVTARAGAEWRHRVNAPDTSAPFVEFTGEYHYTEESFISGGYSHSIEEASDPTTYTDQKMDRFFVSVQHSFTALIVGSASIDYEPATLQARPGHVPPATNLDESTRRMGVALTYLPRKNWMISATYDYDRVLSDEPSRTTERQRVGINAAYTF
jgi:hypothetical protein